MGIYEAENIRQMKKIRASEMLLAEARVAALAGDQDRYKRAMRDRDVILYGSAAGAREQGDPAEEAAPAQPPDGGVSAK